MKVSIIITVYNIAEYIAEAIDSALNQTYKNIEIIVVNDGSSDNSSAVLTTYGDQIQVINQENRGAAHALNTGIKAAKGDFYVFLDGDDIMQSTRIATQLKQFCNNPELEASFGMVEQFLSPELANKNHHFNFQNGPQGFQSKISLMCVREVFEKYGYIPDVQFQDFIIWFDTAKTQGIQFNETNDVVAYRRIRENSLSQQPGYYPSLLRYLRDRINKKRAL